MRPTEPRCARAGAGEHRDGSPPPLQRETVPDDTGATLGYHWSAAIGRALRSGRAGERPSRADETPSGGVDGVTRTVICATRGRINPWGCPGPHAGVAEIYRVGGARPWRTPHTDRTISPSSRSSAPHCLRRGRKTAGRWHVGIIPSPVPRGAIIADKDTTRMARRRLLAGRAAAASRY